MTKAELIQALQALDCSDDTPIVDKLMTEISYQPQLHIYTHYDQDYLVEYILKGIRL